jgi:hypothetical protein
MRPACSIALFIAFAIAPAVQAEQPKIGELYKCTDNRTSLRVAQCSDGNPGLCDVDPFIDGKPQARMRLASAVVNDLLRICQGSATPQSASPSAQLGVADANGFKIGDTVSINTALGWMDAKILKANGDSYWVHAQSGAEVSKPYPSELRRIGPLNDIDRAHGLYALHDRVKVNVEGRWEDGEVVMEMGREYQVALAGSRTVWAAPERLRFVTAQQNPPPAAAGQPPQPGMMSCAGKVEGRYSSSQVGAFTIVFRQGKAQVKMYGDGDEELECWLSGKKIILRKPGAPNEDMPIEINDDGTLDTPMGEVKRKSSS